MNKNDNFWFVTWASFRLYAGYSVTFYELPVDILCLFLYWIVNLLY